MRIRPAAQKALHDPVTRRCLMHPNLPDLYRRKVSELERPLDDGADPEEARKLICSMIDRVVLKPVRTPSRSASRRVGSDRCGLCSRKRPTQPVGWKPGVGGYWGSKPPIPNGNCCPGHSRGAVSEDRKALLK